jgi:hypothetical protein
MKTFFLGGLVSKTNVSKRVSVTQQQNFLRWSLVI